MGPIGADRCQPCDNGRKRAEGLTAGGIAAHLLRSQMTSTYRAELAALTAAGLLTPSPAEMAKARREAREAREALAAFRQQWQALPSRR